MGKPRPSTKLRSKRTPTLRDGAMRRIHRSIVETADMDRCRDAFEGLPPSLTLSDQIVVAAQLMAHALATLTPEMRVEMFTGFFSLTHDALDRSAAAAPGTPEGNEA